MESKWLLIQQWRLYEYLIFQQWHLVSSISNSFSFHTWSSMYSTRPLLSGESKAMQPSQPPMQWWKASLTLRWQNEMTHSKYINWVMFSDSFTSKWLKLTLVESQIFPGFKSKTLSTLSTRVWPQSHRFCDIVGNLLKVLLHLEVRESHEPWHRIRTIFLHVQKGGP